MHDFAASLRDGRLEETDLALANCLQIAPRAPWATLGDVLGLSAATVARRWRRLAATGQAWVTATGSPSLWRSLCNAFLDIQCHPAQRGRVALALARDPRTKSVMEVASGRDLHVNVMTADLPALSRFVLDQVSRLPGVVKVDVQIATRIYMSGSAWRLDALSRSQRERLQPATPTTTEVRTGLLSPTDHALLLALAPDGRLPVTDLAERTGASHTATRRRLSRLEHSGTISFRCEISQQLTGWPVTTLLWGRVPPGDRKRVSDRLSRMPEVRLLVATSGGTNFRVSTWLRSTDSAHELEERINAALPEFEIVEHAVVLRTVKRLGWILDGLGRRRECAPIDPWCGEDTRIPQADPDEYEE
ncbi:Lrp/AsnC family transcriptional regulator [Streptomyces sp. NPDC002896]|uniref:Lrp/AsnC family transcriptional regulator n=1 Tax=Streptomyces sp. NPDC002896 TaxID=3154438 RepID=UPI00331C4AEA